MAKLRVSEKRCARCDVVKSRNEFWINNKGNIAHSVCRNCHNVKRREIYNDPIAGVCYREAGRLWHERNKDSESYIKRSRSAKQRWARNNAEKVRNSLARWMSSDSNREKARAWRAAAKKANPESVLRSNHNRRARKGNNGGKLSPGLTENLLKLQKRKCACCLISLDGSGYHLDHIYPLFLGGANTDLNMQLLCPKCNLEKHAKDPLIFMQSRGFLL